MRIRFGDCVFDSDTRELLRLGRPVPLPPKVFQLLEALILDRPKALSKAALHERLWPGTFVTDSNLANLVADLRLAIGDDGKNPRIIRTVQRYGYAFQAEAALEADVDSAPKLPDREPRDRLLEESPGPVEAALPASALDRRGRTVRFAAMAGLVALGLAGGLLLDRRGRETGPPTFRQLTFRSGSVRAARFSHDERTIVYSTEWLRRPIEIFTQPIASLEARPFGLEGAALLALSSANEMAVSLSRKPSAEHWIDPGTLARISLTGVGAPRELVEDAYWADWSSDGRELAVVRKGSGPWTLEYPPGRVLVRKVAGYLTHPRVSRRSDLVAYADHPLMSDDRGTIFVVDRRGRTRALTPELPSVWGLAWSPDGSEVWFSGALVGPNRSLHSVGLNGRRRTLASSMSSLRLEDVSPSGRALLVRDDVLTRAVARAPGASEEADLTWLDMSVPRAISRDGALVLFVESGEAGGPGNASYLRKTDGSPAIRLGEGDASDLSADGKWALAISRAPNSQSLLLYPTRSGESRTISLPGLSVKSAAWFPDGDRILVSASEPGHDTRLYVVSLSGRPPLPVSAPGYEALGAAVSPDGTLAVVEASGGRLLLHPLDGRPPFPLPGLGPNEDHCGWASDGRHLFVAEPHRVPRRIDRLDWTTGKREPWGELSGGQRAGLIHNIRVAPDGRSYVYSSTRYQGDLYLAEGLE